MLIVNLLNGVMLASVVCFAVGAVLLAIQAGMMRGQAFGAQVQAAIREARFQFGRKLIVIGGVFAVASFVVVFVLSASLPRCTESPENLDEAVAMCMPVAPAPPPAA